MDTPTFCELCWWSGRCKVGIPQTFGRTTLRIIPLKRQSRLKEQLILRLFSPAVVGFTRWSSGKTDISLNTFFTAWTTFTTWTFIITGRTQIGVSFPWNVWRWLVHKTSTRLTDHCHVVHVEHASACLVTIAAWINSLDCGVKATGMRQVLVHWLLMKFKGSHVRQHHLECQQVLQRPRRNKRRETF